VLGGVLMLLCGRLMLGLGVAIRFGFVAAFHPINRSTEPRVSVAASRDPPEAGDARQVRELGLVRGVGWPWGQLMRTASMQRSSVSAP
jgi:hypothetical protein